MVNSPRCERARGGPGARGRVVEFRAAKVAAASLPARDEHLTARKQRRGMVIPPRGERAGGGPGAGGGVVEFRAAEVTVAVVAAFACDEYLAARQERRGVLVARDVERAGGGPDAGGGVVELRCAEGAAASQAAGDEHVAGKKSGGMGLTRCRERTHRREGLGKRLSSEAKDEQ
jgi:hypothetical protein